MPAALVDRTFPGPSRRAVLKAAGAGLALSGGFGIGRARAAEKVLRLGVQKSATFALLRAHGVLERVLEPAGVAVVWREFPGGPQMLEALNVGAIDFATTGEAPPIFAQAAGAPLVYVACQPKAPAGEAILIPKSSPLQTIADLRGKRVALNKGSNVHYLLVRALASANLTLADITAIYLPPADARAAFEQGSVDAWVIWDPFLSAARAGTEARTLVDATGLAPNRQYSLASRALVDTQPDTIRTILAEHDKSDRWASENREEAAKALAPGMGLPVPVVLAAMDGLSFGIETLTPEVIAGQQRIADTFAELRLIPAKIDVASAVWARAS